MCSAKLVFKIKRRTAVPEPVSLHLFKRNSFTVFDCEILMNFAKHLQIFFKEHLWITFPVVPEETKTNIEFNSWTR